MATQEQPGQAASLVMESAGFQASVSSFASGALDQGKHLAGAAHAKIQSAHPHKLKAVAVIGVTVLVWALLQFSRGPHAPPSGWNFLAWATFLLTLVPMSCGALVILISGSTTPVWLIKFSEWMDRRAASSRVSEGRFNQFIARPALWSYEALDEQANRIADDLLRNGAKVATYAFAVILFALLLFWLTMLVLFVVMLFITLAVVKFFIDQSEGKSSGGSTIISRTREGLFGGKYTEHVDSGGNVVGTSREREGMFGGKYVEHTDERGNVAGQSKEREGLFGGKYSEHTNVDGDVVGTTRERERLFGDKYAEHSDASSNQIGESRKLTGLFGDEYTETKKKDS